MHYVVAIAIGIMAITIAARSDSPQQPASDPGIKIFNESVSTILERHCVDCHGGKHQESGLDMRTREGLLKGGDWGPAFVPGKSAESQMMALVRHEDEPFMPEDKPKLPDEVIAALAAWIDAGAPYSRPLTPKPAK